MAKFKDGSGIEREIKLDTGLIEDVVEKHGVELDTLFMEDGNGVMELLYGKPRKFAPILADLCRLTGDEAKTFARGLNAESMQAARTAFLDDLSSFFLPPGARGAFLKAVEEAGTNFDPSGGSVKPTESVAASSA